MVTRVYIRTLDPEGTLRDLCVTHSPVRLGRAPDNDIVLDHPEVSRLHGLIRVEENGLRWEDRSRVGCGLQASGLPLGQGHWTPGAELAVAGWRVSAALRRADLANYTDARQVAIASLHRALVERVDLSDLNDRPAALRLRVEEALRLIARERGIADDGLLAQVSDEALGLGPLTPILQDPRVKEVMVVGPERVYVERGGTLEPWPARFSSETCLRQVAQRIVSPLGRTVDESNPIVDGRLPDGSRVHVIIPPLSLQGTCLTIRRFGQSPLGLDDLLSTGALTADAATFLESAVLARRNILVAGGTGTGKTTLLNVLSAFVPGSERIVTIEDAAELQLDQEHVVSLEARPANSEQRGAVSIRDLVRASLRMRPDRIVVGECRGGEALDMLQAMNSGHEGSMTTLHANSPEEALQRLELLALLSGVDLPLHALRQQIASSIHVVVQLQRSSGGHRRVSCVAEVAGLQDGEILCDPLFVLDGSRLRSTGLAARFAEDRS